MLNGVSFERWQAPIDEQPHVILEIENDTVVGVWVGSAYPYVPTRAIVLAMVQGRSEIESQDGRVLWYDNSARAAMSWQGVHAQTLDSVKEGWRLASMDPEDAVKEMVEGVLAEARFERIFKRTTYVGGLAGTAAIVGMLATFNGLDTFQVVFGLAFGWLMSVVLSGPMRIQHGHPVWAGALSVTPPVLIVGLFLWGAVSST